MPEIIQITPTARLVVDVDDSAEEPDARAMGFETTTPDERAAFAAVHAQWANGGVMSVTLERAQTLFQIDGDTLVTRTVWDVADSLGGCYLEEPEEGEYRYTAQQCALDSFELTAEERAALGQPQPDPADPDPLALHQALSNPKPLDLTKPSAEQYERFGRWVAQAFRESPEWDADLTGDVDGAAVAILGGALGIEPDDDGPADDLTGATLYVEGGEL